MSLAGEQIFQLQLYIKSISVKMAEQVWIRRLHLPFTINLHLKLWTCKYMLSIYANESFIEQNIVEDVQCIKFFYKLQKFNFFKYRPFKVEILLKQKAKLKINEVLNFYPVFDLNFTVDLIQLFKTFDNLFCSSNTMPKNHIKYIIY